MTASSRLNVARLAVLPDFPEEHWPSMDLCAERLVSHLLASHRERLDVSRVCAKYRRRAALVPLVGRGGAARNADRLYNRQWVYPRFAAQQAKRFDLFHVVDHSYAQVVHALPAARTGVFCHDLDTFRCLLAPHVEPRPRWFRVMARRALTGLQKAAVVFHATLDVRRQIEALNLIDPVRLVHAPLGVDPVFSATAPEPHAADGCIGEFARGQPFVLNVGSCIERKRIDVLLDTFAELRRHHAHLKLVQVGGVWTEAQVGQIERLHLSDHVRQVRDIKPVALASLYHRAAVVVQPTEAEGFGLPLAEALACGAGVVTSDLPVLREVGGDACVYAPVGDPHALARRVDRYLTRHDAPPRDVRLKQGARYAWDTHARIIADAYVRLAEGTLHTS